MTQKTVSNNRSKSNDPMSTDAYTALISRMKKRRMIAFITSILVFGFLSFFSGQGLLQTHWFTFILLSIASGCWILFLSRLISWLLFLRPRLKNKMKKIKNTETVLISKALKKSQQSLIIFSSATGFLLFSIFILLKQQPYDDGTMYVIAFSDVILLIGLSAFLSLMAFIIITGFIGFILRITLFQNSSRHHSSDSLNYLGENHPFPYRQRFEEDEPDLASQLRENWDHDPMNPASAEYQSTYHPWHHD
jgi:MFS family permease